MTPPLDPQAVILRIREIVALRGGPKAVAEAASLPLPTLETYLTGKSLPGSLALASLSVGLNVSSDWLLFGKAAHERRAIGEVQQ